MSSTGRRPNWTEKQKRKQASKGRTRHWLSVVPAWYKRQLNRKTKAENRAAMREVKKEEKLGDTTFKPFRKDAHWTWW